MHTQMLGMLKACGELAAVKSHYGLVWVCIHVCTYIY